MFKIWRVNSITAGTASLTFEAGPGQHGGPATHSNDHTTNVFRGITSEEMRSTAAVLNELADAVDRSPKYPEGTPEYEAYVGELRLELAKFVAREEPYDKPTQGYPGAARAAGFGL